MTCRDRRAAIFAGFASVLTAMACFNAIGRVSSALAQPAAAVQADDLKDAPPRAWDGTRDLPADIRSQRDVAWDYPIAYVRIPRPYPKEYLGINHLNQAGLHQTNAPGAELRLLHPDGRDELLVGVKAAESITDPMVSMDGNWVYYAKYYNISTGPSASMTKIQSRGGADIFRVHVRTREVVQLTHQEKTPNTGAIAAGEQSHPRGVHNLGPCPVAGRRVVFVSDRNGVRGVREQTQPAVQLFVMDEDGNNVEHIGPMNLGGALHPVALVDGRVMFSSLETQGLRSDERWGIWHVNPDGTGWGPLTSALGSPPGQAVHFQAQLSNQSIVVESYYQTGSTDGFGTFWRFPLAQPYGDARFSDASGQYTPVGMVSLTRFASFEDVRPNHGSGQVNNHPHYGNVTHPSAAPDGNLLLVWAPPAYAQDQSTDVYDAGIYLIPGGRAINHPSKMLMVKNDPAYQEVWPKAVVPYKRIYGVDEPRKLEFVNDGTRSPHLPVGTPFGLVGSSSLYKRESYPSGKVPAGSVTASARKPADRKAMWRDLAVARFGKPGNWGEQGGDAGLYANDDIWGIRILALEPVSDATFKKARHFALGSDSEERIRVLGEFPVRKFTGDQQPTDPDGNPDTSFLAKLPADVAWTFQTLDNNGMVVNMAQTWHQVRPGEVRTNCGGCHAHSQKPTDFHLTAAGKADFAPWDLTQKTPVFATRSSDETGKKWDRDNRTGVRYAAGVVNVEFYRDIKPLLERSCVACHASTTGKPAGGLPLDDDRPHGRSGLVPWAENVHLPKELPHTYARLVQYAWAFQSRRSPLMWKLHGRRLDGFANEDVESPKINYDDDKDVLNWCHHSKRFQWDVDYTGTKMPPPDAVAGTFKDEVGKLVRVPDLTQEEKLTIARWIDIGCPIDLDFDPAAPQRRGKGWMLDEGRPTLTLPFPRPGTSAQPLSEIVIGVHDYYTGIDLASLSVTADFDCDGVAKGTNLAPRFDTLEGGRWRMKLKTPIASLSGGTITVSVSDREGNQTRIERTFSIEPAPLPPDAIRY